MGTAVPTNEALAQSKAPNKDALAHSKATQKRQQLRHHGQQPLSGWDTLHKWDMGSRSGLGSSPLESTSLRRLSNRNFKQLLQQEQFHNDEIKDKRSLQVSFIMQQQVKNTYLRLAFLHRDVARRLRPSVRVSIPDATLVKSTLAPYHVYVIHVVTDNGWWRCGRRYSEFRSLRDCLLRTFGKLKLPEFPRRKILMVSPDKVAQERRQMLEEYLRAILHSRAANEDFIWSFLGVPEIFQLFDNKEQSHPAALQQARQVFNGMLALESGSFIHGDFAQPMHDVKGLSTQLWAGDADVFFVHVSHLLSMTTEKPGSSIQQAKLALPPLTDFMILVIVKSRIPFTTCVTALILVDRLRQKGLVVNASEHLFFVVSLIVASKYLHDMPERPVYNNWFGSKAIFALEFKFLRALDFELFISTRDYNNFLSMVEGEWTNRAPPEPAKARSKDVAGTQMSKSDSLVQTDPADALRHNLQSRSCLDLSHNPQPPTAVSEPASERAIGLHPTPDAEFDVVHAGTPGKAIAMSSFV